MAEQRQSRRTFLKTTAAGAAVLASCSLPGTQRKPNIVYILADDLGYGELGCYGQEKIKTPNIDRLAAEGMRFSQHYSGSPVCAPSRCTLLTGKHTGHACIRGNDEVGSRGNVWDFTEMEKNPYLEGQRPLPQGTVTLPGILKRAGYRTACIGKWGLGWPGSEGDPTRQGFDLFFGYNCQRQAHTYYPHHLWRNSGKIKLSNKLVIPHNTPLPQGADPLDPESYREYTQTDYAPEFMGREALRFIDENRNNPFFLYFSTTLPHLALQAPPEYVERYHKIFGEEEPYTGKGYFPCRYPRATYAAMISYLDDQVGQIVARLKKHEIYDNTLFIFTSDNGPTYTGGVDTDFFNSAGPFQNGYGRTKGFTYEGGIRVPMIAVWPGHITAGSESDRISAFWDVMPTFCEAASITPPTDTDGLSFLPALLNRRGSKEHKFLYWEFPEYGGQQAVRLGKWKGIRRDIRKSNMTIELYDLESDIREENDISSLYPEVIGEIEQIMSEQHHPSPVERFKLTALGD